MKPWMVYAARALALLWAGFWIFFFVASVIVEGAPRHVIVPGAAVLLLFVILALGSGRGASSRGHEFVDWGDLCDHVGRDREARRVAAPSGRPRDHDRRFHRTAAGGRDSLPDASSVVESPGLRPRRRSNQGCGRARTIDREVLAADG